MERLDAMQQSEAQLKVLVDRLARVREKGLAARSERAHLRLLLRARLVAMRSGIDAVAHGLDQYGREELAWQVRMSLPLFGHLETVINMADEGALAFTAA
jgi:hypothetical protein